MKRQITFSELMSVASKMASSMLRNHRRSCTACKMIRNSDGTRTYECSQVKPYQKTWAQCLSEAFREMYRRYWVVFHLSADEVLQRIRENEEFAAVTEFESHLSYNP